MQPLKEVGLPKNTVSTVSERPSRETRSPKSTESLSTNKNINTKSNLSKNTNPNPPKPNVFEITSNPAKTLLPHVLVESSVSNIPLSLLVDSGSSVSLIKYSCIEKHPKLESEMIKLKGIDSEDEPINTKGHFQLKIYIDKQKKITHKFHVVDKIHLPYDGIIGSDLLNAYSCNINYTNDLLHIGKLSLKLHFNDPAYIIPARTETVIECSITNPNLKEGMILDQKLSDSLIIANCIVRVKQNNRVNLSVVNTSEEPIVVNSNLSLKLQPIDPLEFQNHPVIHTNISTDSLKRTEEVFKQLRISHLNAEEAQALLQLCSDFSDIFHLPGEHLSCTNALKHEIKTTSDIPIHTKTYRFPEVHKAEVKNQINKMLEQNIIEPSDSPWSSPIWVVPKKLDASNTQKWRVVIDYRRLNDVTIGDTYPIPQITEILDQLGNSKYFSTLDLASGFHQIKLNEADKVKTAFNVPEGHFQFLRMPFGLKNAPSTFQRLMNSALSGLQGTRCFVYLDDIVCYSYDIKSHILNLTSIFQRIRQFNLKLQPDKCEFLRREVCYLGHVITEQGVKPNPDKIKAVTEYPVPKSPKDIKSFLGLVSYYRRFIPEFSQTAKPLTNLLKKDTAFIWENQHQLAFEILKRKLTSAPLLIYPDFTKPFILTCDASNYAVGAVLSQGQIGKDRPVAFASRTLNKSECNYSTTEKELLAILYGCKTFRPYLYGNKFQIVTDHRPLKWLFNHKDPGSKLQRWRLKLEEYEYEIVYRKGKLNSAADALSRYPVNPVYPTNKDDLNPNPIVESNEDPIAESNQSHNAESNQNPTTISSPNSSPLEIPQATLDELIRTDFSPLNDVDFDFSFLDPMNESEPLTFPESPNHQDPIQESTPAPINPAPPIPEKSPDRVDPVPLVSKPNPRTPLSPISDNANCPVVPDTSPLPDDNYNKFLKSPTKTHDTIILEHNEDLLKCSQKLIIIPTSIDMDESLPYIQDIINNCPNPQRDEFLKKERSLHTVSPLTIENKTYLFLFTKVHHFDDNSYPDIFKSLKYARDEIMMSYSTIYEISISDFRNPFDRHSFIKIYNMLAYLFDGTNIKIHIYHNNIIYPSLSEIPKILKENHDIPIAGHLGSARMFSRIKERFSWKNMRSDIENYIKQCPSCQTNKALRQINRAPMVITSTSTSPFERLALDIVGPLPESGTAKLKYILTMQDDLTKFSLAYPLRSNTAEETSECLLHFISLFGIPKHILTDQGTNFTAELFKKTCEFLKIKQLWSSPYHPQTQGALERSHSTLKEYLKSYVNENQNNWPKYVYTSMLAYNTAVHSTTHYSPFELLFGHKPRIPDSVYDDNSDTTYPDYVKLLQHRLKHARDIAIEYIHKSKINSKNYYDTRTRPVTYKVGDQVFLKNHLRLRKALSPMWKGPYKVIKVHGNHTVTLLINRRHVKHHFDEIKLADVRENITS